MATPFHFELLTPERVLFTGEAEEVSLRTDGGEIAFLAHHEDYIAAVDITAVRVHAPVPDAKSVAKSSDVVDGVLSFAVHGGFVEVNHEGVILVAGVAELSSEIDTQRAERALSVAQERASTESVAADETHGVSEEAQAHVAMSSAALALLAPESPDAAMRRARTRLEVAGSPSAR